jgi:hypothetical protein
MDTEILKAIAQENVLLRKELNKDREPEEGIKFYVLSEQPLKISGVLISEGIWKGIKFSYDEMKKVADKFKEVPVLVEHGKVKNTSVGKILEVAPNDCLKALIFTAEITDPDIIEGIKAGKYDAISIKGAFDKVTIEEGTPIGLGFTPIEVSITSSPACDRCLIFVTEQLSEDKEEKEEKWKCPFCDHTYDKKEEFIEHLIKEFKNRYAYPYKYGEEYPEKYGDKKMSVENTTTDSTQVQTQAQTQPVNPPTTTPTPEPAQTTALQPQAQTPTKEEPVAVQTPAVEPAKVEQPAPKVETPATVQPTAQPVAPAPEAKAVAEPVMTPKEEAPQKINIDELIEEARKEGKLLDLATRLFFESVKKR